MKRIYLCIAFGGLIFGSATAQRVNTSAPLAGSQITTDTKAVNEPNFTAKAGVEVWSNDFDTPADWVIDNDGQAGGAFGWTIDNTSDGWWSSAGINSTSGGNYAEVSNGDAQVGDMAIDVTYTMTLAASIDIPNLPLNTTNSDLVTLQFEEYGARFNDIQEVQIATVASPGALDWVTVRDNLGYSVLSQAGGSPYANPETVTVNLSPYVAGNANTVWIRFKWTTNFPGNTDPNAWITYGWYVDDVKIFTNPDDDLQLWSSWIAGENNEGIEYGRTPSDQVDANWTIGGQVYNNGVNAQTNVTLDADFTSFTAQANEASIATQDTVFMETIDPVTMAVGTYTGNYTLQSDNEQIGGPDFADNTGTREFEITDPSTTPGTIYSQDGMGVYSNSTVSSIGTNSFTGGEDGLVLGTMYHIKQTADVSAIRIMLASGSAAGGEVYGSIKDTSLWFLNDMTSLYSTQSVTLTNLHIAQGYVDLPFASTISLAPGAYYAAAELYSNGGTSDVRVDNDETVPQPFFASMVYIPGDQVYSNGVAFGIRLLMGDFAGVNENELDGVSVYPNPSEGIVNISNDNNTEHTITVHDMAGRVVTTTTASTATTLDLSGNGTGVYTVTVENENGSIVERVVIK